MKFPQSYWRIKKAPVTLDVRQRIPTKKQKQPLMFIRIFSLLLLLAGALIPTNIVANAQQTEYYTYVIFYEESGCELSTVSFLGFTAGDEKLVSGGLDNTTQLCSVEAACHIRGDIEICQQQIVPTVNAEVRFDIDSNGKTFQCDDSNENLDQPICRFLEGCLESSLLPNCHFQVATTKDIVNNRKCFIALSFAMMKIDWRQKIKISHGHFILSSSRFDSKSECF